MEIYLCVGVDSPQWRRRSIYELLRHVYICLRIKRLHLCVDRDKLLIHSLEKAGDSTTCTETSFICQYLPWFLPIQRIRDCQYKCRLNYKQLHRDVPRWFHLQSVMFCCFRCAWEMDRILTTTNTPKIQFLLHTWGFACWSQITGSNTGCVCFP